MKVTHLATHIFNDVHVNADDVVEIVAQPDLWEGLTGFFVHSDCIPCEVGARKKATDTDTGRKYLFVGTRFGTVVVFDKYPRQNLGQYTTFTGVKLSCDDLIKIIGTDDPTVKNIGQMIEFIHDNNTNEELVEQIAQTTQKLGDKPT